MLAASIAACSGTVLRKILEKKRIQLKDMIIETKEERISEEAGRIKVLSFISRSSEHCLGFKGFLPLAFALKAPRSPTRASSNPKYSTHNESPPAPATMDPASK